MARASRRPSALGAIPCPPAPRHTAMRGAAEHAHFVFGPDASFHATNRQAPQHVESLGMCAGLRCRLDVDAGDDVVARGRPPDPTTGDGGHIPYGVPVLCGSRFFGIAHERRSCDGRAPSGGCSASPVIVTPEALNERHHRAFETLPPHPPGPLTTERGPKSLR